MPSSGAASTPPTADQSPPKTNAEPLPATATGLARAAQLLLAGKLLIVPTETVYGIAFSLRSPDARQRIRTLKKIIGTPNWVLHLPNANASFDWARDLQPIARRLMSKALPGPIGFQMKLSESDLAAARARLGEAADETITDGALTLRSPDHSLLQELLAHPTLASEPIAVIGAGTAKQPAAYELAEIPAETLSAVDATLDGGPTRYRKPSTLVRLEGANYSVVRAGVIDERIIHRLADFNILFVCTGNTCRSPMAASIAIALLADRLHVPPQELAKQHVVVQSAGVHASRGLRATREAAEAVKGVGGDLSRHISQPVTPDLLRRADVIYTMTSAHREEILDTAPGFEYKVLCLDPDTDVEDPFGSDLSTYRAVAGRLAELISRRLNELKI